MPTLDDLLERERLKNAPPSPEMQKAIDETIAEIRAAFDRPRDPAPTPALNREEADRHG